MKNHSTLSLEDQLIIAESAIGFTNNIYRGFLYSVQALESIVERHINEWVFAASIDDSSRSLDTTFPRMHCRVKSDTELATAQAALAVLKGRPEYAAALKEVVPVIAERDRLQAAITTARLAKEQAEQDVADKRNAAREKALAAVDAEYPAA